MRHVYSQVLQCAVRTAVTVGGCKLSARSGSPHPVKGMLYFLQSDLPNGSYKFIRGKKQTNKKITLENWKLNSFIQFFHFIFSLWRIKLISVTRACWGILKKCSNWKHVDFCSSASSCSCCKTVFLIFHTRIFADVHTRGRRVQPRPLLRHLPL